jgi:hypothetical protein
MAWHTAKDVVLVRVRLGLSLCYERPARGIKIALRSLRKTNFTCRSIPSRGAL